MAHVPPELLAECVMVIQSMGHTSASDVLCLAIGVERWPGDHSELHQAIIDQVGFGGKRIDFVPGNEIVANIKPWKIAWSDIDRHLEEAGIR